VSKFRFFRALVLPGLLVGLAACSSAPPAPKPKPYPVLPAEQVKLTREWKVSVGDGLADENIRLLPAVGEQHVIAASRDGVMLSIDRESGKILWKLKTKLPITAGPAVAYGLIVIGTTKGDVIAYAEEDGKQKWKVSVGAMVMAAPALSADTVVVLTADGVIHALARDTGVVRWTYSTTVPPLSLHANATPLISGNRVYVATSGGKLIALDLESGVAGWELRVATNNGRTELERMTDIASNLLLVGDNELYSVGFQSQLTVTDADAGRRRWQFDISSVNDLAEGLGNIYVTDTDANVFAVDRASGKSVWKQPDYAYRHLTGPVIFNNLVVVGDDDGNVHFLAQSDGQVRGRVRVVHDALSALIAHDDVLYTWSIEGVLSAWKVTPPKS
jgi:outer membrane protein assembly factor BamB